MNYQELRSLVGGSNPQDVSYQDIVSGIQSQYRPQTQFAPTRSLLDMIGSQLPDQPRIGYGSLLQPSGLPTSIDLSGSVKNTDAAASVDSGVLNSITTGTGKITDNSDLSNSLVYNNNFTNTNTTGGVTAGDVTKTGSVMAALGTLAGSSDLAKAGIALNLIGSGADIKSETDEIGRAHV